MTSSANSVPTDQTSSEPHAVRRTQTLGEHISGVANGAMTYSGVAASVGTFALFGLSLSSAGPAYFWSWPVVTVPVAFMVLVFAELSSHYPRAGVMYEWPRILVGRAMGWWVGWIYLFGSAALLAATYFVVAVICVPLFGIADTLDNQLWLAGLALVVATVFNVIGLEVLGRFTLWGAMAELVIMLGIVTVVLVGGHGGSVHNLVDTGGTGSTFGKWLPGFLGGGVFSALFVMYTFENAGTLGEETVNGPKQAPRAILGSFLFTFVVGLYFLGVFLSRTPNIGRAEAAPYPPLYIMDHSLPHWLSTVYLVLLLELTLLAGNVYMAAVSRQVFGMARGGELPFSRGLRRISRRGNPWVAVLVVAAVSAIPFAFASSFTVLATGATAAMYVPYVLVIGTVLYARLRHKWPRKEAPFSLGRFGTVVNVLALMGATAIMVNLVWFRSTTDPVWHFGIPVAFWLIGLPVLGGGVYYLLHQRGRSQTEVDAEAEA